MCSIARHVHFVSIMQNYDNKTTPPFLKERKNRFQLFLTIFTYIHKKSPEIFCLYELNGAN